MKKRLLTGLLALVLTVAVLPTAALADAEDVGPEDEVELVNPFPDVPDGADYAEAVIGLAAAGIITGDGNGNFNPHSTITRAEMAAIICRLMGAEDEIVTPDRRVYNDVETDYWACGYIAKATELGIFNGDGTGNFRPTDNVTYEQAAKMLVCAMGYEAEAQAAGGWPNGYLRVGEELGITAGVSFAPSADAPRSMVAMLTYSAISNV